MKDYSGLEIAIIGMAGRFPGAGDVQAFWNNLANGVESISFFTDEELIKEGVDKDLIDDPLYVKANGLLEDKDCFDSSFFNYRPDEAKLMEPQMRIFHECVWAALEDAGWNPDDEKSKVGLFAGADTNINWELYALLANRKGYVDDFSVSLLANPRFLSTKISYNLNLKGPSIYLDTACSTSLVAVHQACKSLLLGECNMAVAGGIHVTGKSRTGYKYQEGMVNSRDGHCRTFDDAASGTVGGEGAGAVVLKTLKNALKDGDHIWAVIKGSGINNDGSNKAGYTAPSIHGQVEAILMAQKWAQVPAESIGYIEAHGTATRLGDPVEVEALVRVFGKSSEKYCALGSVKSNIGHLDAAAGIAGLIKTVLAIKHRQIPPSLHFQTLNREIDLGNTPFYVNNILREWRKDKYPLRAGISSFGIGGTNAHIVLEEAPQMPGATEGMPYQVLTLSAKTPAALGRLTERFCDYFRNSKEDNLPDVAYTLQTGRRHHPYRKSLVCSSCSEALSLLVSGKAIENGEPVTDRSNSKKMFMFSGQGSQYINMCYDLYIHEPVFKEEVDHCLEIIKERTDKDLLAVLFNDSSRESHPINNTEYAQPLLFVVEYALARLLMKWGVMPDFMIGHSIGEYVAACISGVFSLEDALWLVIRRGELMQSAPSGIMLSVSISPEKLRPMLAENRELSLAAVNSRSLCVVSGGTEAIHDFMEMLTREGYPSKVLRTSHAFHSCMMDGILDSFKKEVRKVAIHAPKIPFVSNLTGDWANPTEISSPDYWADHLRKTVLFSDGIQRILENEQVVLIEAGPGRALCAMALSNQMRTKTHKVFQLVRNTDEDMNDVQFLLVTLGQLWRNGAGPDWSLMHKNEVRRKLSLPGYPFEKTRYPVCVDPYRTLADEVTGEHLQKKNDIADWMYVPSWKMVPRLSNVAPDRPGGWTLLLADNCGIGKSLAAEYKKYDQHLIYVTAGESYNKKEDGIYEVCPRAKGDFTILFADLEQHNQLPDRIIHAWGVTTSEESDFSTEALHLGFFSLVETVQAMRHYGELTGKRIVLLSSGIYRILDERHKAGVPALTPALLIVLSQEFQGLCTSHIDISLSDSGAEGFHHLLYREIQMVEKGIVICLRHGKRWQQIFEKIRPAADGIPGGHFRKRGVYLITGGLGNFGFNIAGHLLAKYSARVVLLGRTKHPSPEKMKLLEQLQVQGGEIFYQQANIADLTALDEAVRTCEEKFGKLHGVIHAAGITNGTSFNPVKALKKEDFYAQFEPKVLGLQTLREVIGDRDLDFCLVTSSLSAVLGGIGFGAYAPANAFMDHYINAHKSNGELKNWVSVNFDGFDLEKENADSITCREMVTVLDQVLSLKECSRIVVSVSDLQKRIDKWVTGSDDLLKLQSTVLADDADSLTTTILNLWQNFFGRQDITAEDDFFELGGDSLTAITMTGRIYKVVNIEIPVKEFFSRSSVNRLVEYINAERMTGESSAEYQGIPKSPAQDAYPLSSTQRRLYFLYEFNRSSLAYNLPTAVSIKGVVDIERFRLIINIIARRHEILRTYVDIDGEECVQRIAEDIAIPIEHFKATAEKVALVVQEFVRPFDLSQAPLIRVGLIEVAKDDHVFVIDMHHFISDGVSLAIFLKEFAALYNGEELEVQSVQYRDYAVWQTSEIYQQAIARERNWWLQEFSEEVTLLILPIDYSRPVVLNHAGDAVDLLLNEWEMDGLKKIADAEGATTFMVLFSIYSILLGKLTGQEDLVIGTPASGRNYADLESIMGMVANTLAIRTRPNGALRYHEFLKQLKSNILSVFDHQAYPYELLIKDLKVERDTSRNPLFDVFLLYDNRSVGTFELPGLDISPFYTKPAVSPFDLSLNASERNGSIYLSFVYATELFKQETIERFAGYFKQIISAIISDPKREIHSIDILSTKERDLLINGFNDTKSICTTEETIISLFEKQAKLTPDQIAVVYESRRLTYRQINERSNQLAYRLREQYHVGRDQVVGIMMDRSEKILIGILGILKAGGAYLPIDPVYPKERVEYILKDSGAGVLLVDEGPGNDLEYTGIVLSADVAMNENKQDKDLNRINTSRDLCYLIYTSGSTGRPKGVMISHYNVVNFFYAMDRRLSVSHEDSLLAVTSTAFDISVLELLWTLCSGIEVVIHPSDMSLHSLDRYLAGGNRALDFTMAMGHKPITLMQSTPSFIKAAMESEGSRKFLSSLRLLLVGGEPVPYSLVRELTNITSAAIYNMYGPTETTIWSCMHRFSINEEKVSVGAPILNTRIYILDKDHRLLPMGVAGEVYIGGNGVSRGYWRRPDLTMERFIKNPFIEGEKIYKTGDIGRWLWDGNIELIGREDQQVKIRGYRIELGEIESRLLTFLKIKEAAVVVKQGKEEGDKALVAYIVTEGAVDIPALRRHLGDSLPHYMIPGYFIELSRLPLTPNGKLDRRALPDPEIRTTGDYVVPQTKEERLLADVWSKVLGVERIRATDNFFSIGGDSIKSIQIISRMRAAGYQVSVRDILISQTIKQLALRVREIVSISGQREEFTPSALARKSLPAEWMDKLQARYALEDVYPLSPMQEGMLFHFLLDEQGRAYFEQTTCFVRGPLVVSAAEQSMNDIIARHGALRTAFIDEYNRPLQVVLQERKIDFLVKDCRTECEDNASATVIRRWQEHDRSRKFDLRKDVLMRLTVLRLAEEEYVFIWSYHHIVMDGWCMGLIMNEFLELYRANLTGKPITLPEVKPYSGYIAWLETRNREGAADYWRWYLSGYEQLATIAHSVKTLQVAEPGLAVEQLVITRSLTGQVQKLSVRYGVTTNTILQTAWGILLSKYNDTRDVVFGSVVSVRPAEIDGIETMVGLFINTIPVRMTWNEKDKVSDVLLNIQEAALDAEPYYYHSLPEIQALSSLGRNLLDHILVFENYPLSDVSKNAADNELGLSITELESVEQTNYDLTVTIVPGEEIYIQFKFLLRIYEKQYIQSVAFDLDSILRQMVMEEDVTMAGIEIVADAEKRELLRFHGKATILHPDTAAGDRNAAPRTNEEVILVEAWSQLLGLEKERIGIDSDFFELGGHSLVAIRLIYLIRQQCSIDLAMRQIFDHSSIRKLARLIKSAKKRPARSIQWVEKREYYPVSSAQERLFFEHLLNKDIPIYNTCSAFKIEGQLDIDKLKGSFQSLIMRHEGLRTGFVLTAGDVVQVVNDAPELVLIDLDETRYGTIKEAFDDFVQPFDLSAKSLMRCGLLQHRTEGNILFVDIHHIVCDGISKNILMNDFKSIYNGTVTEPLELSYVDYACWQRNRKDRLHEQKEFWIRSLGDRKIKPDLPVVQNNGSEVLLYAAYELFLPADELVAGIRELAKTSEASVFMILLSVYYLLLSKVSGSTDIVIGTEAIGRTHDQLRNVVGSFVNILPMRMQVRPGLPFTEFLAEVKECVLQAFENQDFQYDQIVAAVREINESDGNLIDAHFSFASTGYSAVDLGELRFIPIDGLWTETTDYGLSLQVSEERNKLYLYFIYSTGYFDKETIQLLMDYYKHILSDALNHSFCVGSNQLFLPI
jgi:iturin family lipopeptide synthetase A